MNPGIAQIEFDDGTTQVVLSGKDIGTGGTLDQQILSALSASGHNRFMGNVGEQAEGIDFSDGKVYSQLYYWMQNHTPVNMLLWRLGDDTTEQAPVAWVNVVPKVQGAETFDPSASDAYPFLLSFIQWGINVKTKDTFDETFDTTFI